MISRKWFSLSAILILFASGCASQISCDEDCSESGNCCNEGYVCIKGACELSESVNNRCSSTTECLHGMTCIEGQCSCLTLDGTNHGTCLENETCCAATGCVDTANDHDNCGQCSFTCQASEGCKSGVCDASICNNGVKRCSDDGKRIEICRNGRWSTTDNVCLGNQTCQNAECVVESCHEGNFRCHDGNVEWCVNKEFTIYSQCKAPKTCDEETLECVVPPECSTGAQRCNDAGNIDECSDDQEWIQIRKCPTGTVCKNNGDGISCVDTAECITNEHRCNGIVLEYCTNGVWKTQSCPNGNICKDGACNERTCVEGETSCGQDPLSKLYQIYTCNNDMLDLTTTCMSGESCVMSGDPSRAHCVKDTCEKAAKCEGNKLFACSNGEFREVKACGTDETCDESSGDCIQKCGNKVLDDGEECDGLIVPKTCAMQLGANYSGTMKCSTACKLDSTECRIQSSGHDTDAPGSTVTDWDYLQDFNSLKTLNSAYDTTNTAKTGDVTWDIVGSTRIESKYYIDTTPAVVFTSKEGTKCHIQASNLTHGIKVLAFDYKGWPGDNGSFTLTFIKGTAESSKTIDFTDSISHYSETLSDASITGIRIQAIDKHTKSNTNRVILDNIRWTNAK